MEQDSSVRKGEDIEERLLDFAVRVGKAIDAMPDTHSEDISPVSLFDQGPLPLLTMPRPVPLKAKKTLSTSLRLF